MSGGLSVSRAMKPPDNGAVLIFLMSPNTPVPRPTYADWGSWVSYKLAARSQGITGYQFRSPMEWFAELYAAYFSKKLNPKHPAAAWLGKLKAEKT